MFKRPDINVNKDFVEFSSDFSIYDNGTKENPVETFPDVNLTFLKDVHRFTGSFKTTDIQTNHILVEQQFNICLWSKKSILGFFLRPIIHEIEKSSKIKFECPFRKGTTLKIKKFNLKNITFASFMPAYRERTVKVVLNQGKNITQIFSITFYNMKVEINE
ncbi:hypothetical protein PVAND_015641 [Polypedilum vanderplanki]|uniref:Uncharacterized protein n=1 Tax=Polypedilum vanderplanki TaxID=319348 RepID=A0A9J6BD57_POLVA|nr:hypothetical protein PVAND_015641 [Polypedilum vanderplanki]